MPGPRKNLTPLDMQMMGLAFNQGGIINFLGQQPEVTAPIKAQSHADSPPVQLAYITDAEKDLLVKSNIHGSMAGKPNQGPAGIPSLDDFFTTPGGGIGGGSTADAGPDKKTTVYDQGQGLITSIQPALGGGGQSAEDFGIQPGMAVGQGSQGAGTVYQTTDFVPAPGQADKPGSLVEVSPKKQDQLEALAEKQRMDLLDRLKIPSKKESSFKLDLPKLNLTFGKPIKELSPENLKLILEQVKLYQDGMPNYFQGIKGGFNFVKGILNSISQGTERSGEFGGVKGSPTLQGLEDFIRNLDPDSNMLDSFKEADPAAYLDTFGLPATEAGLDFFANLSLDDDTVDKYTQQKIIEARERLNDKTKLRRQEKYPEGIQNLQPGKIIQDDGFGDVVLGYGPMDRMGYTAVMPREGYQYSYDQQGRRYEIPIGGNQSGTTYGGNPFTFREGGPNIPPQAIGDKFKTGIPSLAPTSIDYASMGPQYGGYVNQGISDPRFASYFQNLQMFPRRS